MEPAASQKPKGVSLQSLFREYLNEDDSLADVELKPVSKAIEAPRPEPVQPVAVPVPVEPITTTVEIDEPQPVGLLPFWFTDRKMARKAQGPTSISLSWVELFYDLVYAATLASFALNIAWGWPGGKYSNFVQMLMVLSLWLDNVNYTAVFHSQDGVSRSIIFLSLLGVIGMAFHRNVVGSGSEATFQGYVISFFWARFWQIVLYVQVFFTKAAAEVPRNTKIACLGWAVFSAVTCIPAAVTIGLQNDVSIYGRVMIWLVGVGLELLAHLVVAFLPMWRTIMPKYNLKLFCDRLGGLVLFLFGYTLTAIYFDETGPYTVGTWASVALLLLIGFCFMWMYYDGNRHDDVAHGCVAPMHREGLQVWGAIWYACHVPLAMALVVMADASAQIIAYYRGIVRTPNTVSNIALGPNQSVLVLSNSVQWIYGVSFAIVLFLLTVQGLMYEFADGRQAKRRYGRTIGQLSLCIVEVLIPLGGLPSGSQTGSQRLEPIVPIVVGSVVMFVLVVLDWAFQTASAATIPDKEPRTIVVAGNGQQVQALQQQLDAQKAEIAALRAQLAERPREGAVVPRGDVDNVESELSSSKNWGFSSRTSSVVEDVVVSSEGEEESREYGSQVESETADSRGGGGAPSGTDTSEAAATVRAPTHGRRQQSGRRESTSEEQESADK